MLLKGPDMLINLATPLLCSRLNKIAFSADVKHMFHRIQICLRDQQCQRVLYRDDTNKPMETYILNRMAFGPKCSPFVSQYVKNWNADRWFGKYPEAAKAVKESVYMDDVLLSEVSVHKAVNIAKQLIEIFKYINWELVSFQSNSKEFLRQLPNLYIKNDLIPFFQSNSKEFLRQLPNQYIKNDLIPLLEDEQTEHITKVLGCSWNTTEDVFLFQLDKNIFIKLMTEFEHKPTKKDLASLIARIFDIMGFIAHYTIRGKIILQRTWKTKIGWDEAVSNNILNEWKSWLADIKEITKIRIPRMISQLDAIQNAEKLELHSFCDAGIEAFGAVTYLVVHANNQVTSRILMAKAKVTPLRFHTETEIKEIPRLELMSALLAARLSKTNLYNIYLQQLNYSTHQLPPIELDELIDRLSDSIKSSWNKLRRAVARALKILLDGLIPAIKSRQFHDVAMRMEIKQIHNGFKLLTPIDFERAEHFIFRKLQREHFTEEYQLFKN
ncbi:hypothetical protein PVAND_002466 [Polypedilum vanderplanki]|uniref:Reverse transcriptase domain-containing protein n=1 Tax=Polypedilum vanderplanki TaxID=319348 RepID=A0A9J6BR33_POLVA|nr:hypothetical protein PVAND_002466 [Polypedilum vanderplanki]